MAKPAKYPAKLRAKLAALPEKRAHQARVERARAEDASRPPRRMAGSGWGAAMAAALADRNVR